MNLKKAILIFLTVIISLFSMNASCGVSGETLIVEDEMDFNDLIGCDSLLGNIYISNTNISYLTQLSSLTYVEGDFTVYGCTSLLDVDALNSLTHIGGDLIFQVVFTLQNTNGLSNIEYIGGDIIFDTVISISDVNGLSGITNVNGDLLFIDNHVLTNLNGLSSVTSIVGDLYIGTHNTILVDLSGLDDLTSVGGDFYLDLPNITVLSDFMSLESVGGSFTIESCDVMATINGFASLISIEEAMTIRENPILISTNGFESLTFVGDSLSILDNPSYFSCCGLYSILANGSVDGEVNLSGNALSCNSVDQILEDCFVSTPEYETDLFVTKRVLESGVQLFFNSISEPKDVYVYSSLGQLVSKHVKIYDNEVFIPLSSSSIYLIDIRQESKRKVIKTYF